MSSLNIKTVVSSDNATPALKALADLKVNPLPLNECIAPHAEELTRRYLIERVNPAAQRRTQAYYQDKQGLVHTNYFARKGQGTESYATAQAAVVTIPTGDTSTSLASMAGGGSAMVSREAFARVFGPVTITPTWSKYLTIPAIGKAHGRRAREFPFLKFIPFGNGAKALAEKLENGGLKVYYWLKDYIHIKQDVTLLPSDKQFMAAAELGAQDFIDSL